MNFNEPIIINDDTVVINNKNTTIGYAHFNKETNTIEYVFVHPMFRRSGIGAKLVITAEKFVGRILKPAKPISPMGQNFFKSLKYQDRRILG